MAQKIRVSRGSLASKITAEGRLGNGEIFFDKGSKQLYIGDGPNLGPDGKHFKFGGLNTLNFVGDISALPSTPNYGDMYEVTADFIIADDGTGKVVNARVSDFLIYVYNDANKENYDLGTSAKKWIRVNNSGGSAVETTFNPAGTSILSDALDVQKAIVDLDRHKLEYGGVFTSEANCYPGKFYYVENNNVTAIDTDSGEITGDSGATAGVSTGQVYISKGNLVICTSDTIDNGAGVTIIKKYQVVDLGSNANDITLTQALTRRAGSDAFTEYNAGDSVITSLQDVLQRVFSTKADLDGMGKIYLDQLPSTIIGAMEYQGMWTSKVVLPTDADKTVSDTSTENDNNETLIKGDYWIISGDTLYITNTGTIVSEGDEGAIRVNNGDWLIVESYSSGSGAVWNVLSNEATLKGILADGVLHEGSPEFVGDGRAVEVSSPVGGNTILVSAPKALVNVDTNSEVGRIYKASDTLNNVNKSSLIEDATSVSIDGGKNLGIQRLESSIVTPPASTIFTVSETGTGSFTVNGGASYALGDAVAGFLLTINGDGTFTYTAETEGVNTIVAGADTVVVIDQVGTLGGTVIIPGAKATIVQNPAENSNITITLPSVTGTLIVDTDLQSVIDSVTANVTEDYIPVKEGTGFVDSPISRVQVGTDPATGIKVEGTVNLAEGAVTSIVKANALVSSTNTMPATSGEILNQYSDIDGGEYL